MNFQYLPFIAAVAFFLAQPAVSLAADAQGDIYRYTFELTEGKSCEGSTRLKPDEFNRVLAQANTTGSFIQLENYRTASGTEATVGFVNPRYIVSFHLTPSTP